MASRKTSGRARWPVIALAVAGIAGLVSWSVWPSRGVPLANPDDSRQVALGRAIYQDRCASCHGADLRGQPDWQTRKPDGRMPAPPHDASGHTWHHADDQLFGIVKRGIEPYASPGYRSDMPAFAGVLADEEIWAVIAFLKSTWPERERSFQERVSRAMRGRMSDGPGCREELPRMKSIHCGGLLHAVTRLSFHRLEGVTCLTKEFRP